MRPDASGRFAAREWRCLPPSLAISDVYTRCLEPIAYRGWRYQSFQSLIAAFKKVSQFALGQQVCEFSRSK
jgi:hypothetical protein